MSSHDKRVIYLPVDTPDKVVQKYQVDGYDVRFSMGERWEGKCPIVNVDDSDGTTDKEIETFMKEVSKYFRP